MDKEENISATSHDLQGKDFSARDLSQENFAKANLGLVTLHSAKLKNVDFTAANLSGANLTHADLSGANLSNVEAIGTTFHNAKLVGANLSAANCDKCSFTNANLSDADFTDVSLTNANFTGAIFDGTVFSSNRVFSRLKYPLSHDQKKGCLLLQEEDIGSEKPRLRLDSTDIMKQENGDFTFTMIKQNLPVIRPALRLTGFTLLNQLAEFREIVRGDNNLRVEHERFQAELIKALDRLTGSVEALLDAVSNSDGAVTEDEVIAVASKFDEFAEASASEIGKYTNPEAMAKMVVPTGIILGIGTVGALIGSTAGMSAVGFAAGSLVAKLALGHAKPGDVANRIEKEILK